MKKEPMLVAISIILGIIMIGVGNLIDTGTISKKWSVLVIILFLIALGVGLYGFFTITIPRIKKVGNCLKKKQ